MTDESVVARLDIRPLREADWPAVSAIYADGIATGNATFETTVPAWFAWDAGHRPEARLVAVDREGGEIVAFFVLSSYSSRPVYAGVAWESVYVAADRRGQGIGAALLAAGVEAASAAGIWTLVAGVLAENAASLAVHERAGFRRVGVLERIGRDAAGRWRDVVLLERRAAG